LSTNCQFVFAFTVFDAVLQPYNSIFTLIFSTVSEQTHGYRCAMARANRVQGGGNDGGVRRERGWVLPESASPYNLKTG